MASSIHEIYADLQSCMKKVVKLNEYHKEFCFSNTQPLGLAQIEASVVLIQQDLTDLPMSYFTQLQFLINDVDCHIAAFLKPIINDLLHVANWYSTLLRQTSRDPTIFSAYGEEREKLQSLNKELARLVSETLNDTERPLAAQITPFHHQTRFCPGSIQLINGKDEGRVAAVWKKEDIASLTPEQRRVLEKDKGGFMFWRCSACRFKIKYFVNMSEASTLLKTEELRSTGPIIYRAAFLAKSHVTHQSISASCKYGCLFCFSQGLPLDKARSTAFQSSIDLMRHLQSDHSRNVPHPIITERVKTVFGETELQPGTYDLQFVRS